MIYKWHKAISEEDDRPSKRLAYTVEVRRDGEYAGEADIYAESPDLTEAEWMAFHEFLAGEQVEADLRSLEEFVNDGEESGFGAALRYNFPDVFSE